MNSSTMLILSDSEWIDAQVYEYERYEHERELYELYELREWWCTVEQVPQQLDLPLDEPKQPKPIKPF